MRWEFLYHKDANYLEVVVHGNPTSSDLNKMAKERWDKMQALGCKKILFDFTAITSMLTTFEIYHRPEQTERVGILKVNRTAAVAPAAYKRDFKLLEAAYLRRGYDLHVFDTREDAINYLNNAQVVESTS